MSSEEEQEGDLAAAAELLGFVLKEVKHMKQTKESWKEEKKGLLVECLLLCLWAVVSKCVQHVSSMCPRSTSEGRQQP